MFAWTELLPELQNVVRKEGLTSDDSLSRTMLALTCKGEHAQWRAAGHAINTERLFVDACYHGYMNIVQWMANGLTEPEKDELSSDMAVKRGHVDIATWCLHHCIFPTAWLCNDLARHGNIKGLQWLNSHEWPLDGQAFEEANADVPTIRYL